MATDYSIQEKTKKAILSDQYSSRWALSVRIQRAIHAKLKLVFDVIFVSDII
jgi:hypothetical protein